MPSGFVHFDTDESMQAVHHHVAVVLQRDPQAVDRRLHAVERAHGRPLRGEAGPEVCCDWMVAMASITGLLAIAQPMRKPVMAYISKRR